MSRSDNIDIFGAPWKLLSESEQATAERLAEGDAELAADLKFAKSLSALSAAELVGEPPTSDAVFLVGLREQLDQPKTVKVSRWSGVRLWLATATASILLVAGIYWGGAQSESPATISWSDEVTEESLLASNLVWYEDDAIDDLDELDLSTMTDYLDMDEDSDLLAFDNESDEPYSDQILELDNESIEDIISQIESLTFFDNPGQANEG